MTERGAKTFGRYVHERPDHFEALRTVFQEPYDVSFLRGVALPAIDELARAWATEAPGSTFKQYIEASPDRIQSFCTVFKTPQHVRLRCRLGMVIDDLAREWVDECGGSLAAEMRKVAALKSAVEKLAYELAHSGVVEASILCESFAKGSEPAGAGKVES